MKLKVIVLLVFFVGLFAICSAQTQVQTYPFPKNKIFTCKSDKFQIKLIRNNNVYESPVYISNSGPAAKKVGLMNESSFSFSIFSFSGPIKVEVTKLNSTAKTATVRPRKLHIAPVKTKFTGKGRMISFNLNQPCKLSVEFDDDTALINSMVLFANGLEKPEDVPHIGSKNVFIIKHDSDVLQIPTDKTIVYFPAGVHTINYWSIPPYINQVYLSGGSFIRGYLFAKRNKTQPIVINGRGIISNDIYPFHYPEHDTAYLVPNKGVYRTIHIEGGANHVIEGLTLTDASYFNISMHADSSLISNVNVNGFKWNNDGITSIGNNNRIQNCFIRDNDDQIVVYGNSITIQNCIFWHLGGGSIIQLGWSPHRISGNNLIDSCYVIHAYWTNNQQNAGFLNAMNTIANHNEQNPVVENFTVQNIYFDTDVDRFIDLRMRKNGKGEPNSYRNFFFQNIHFYNKKLGGTHLIYLGDYDSLHTVKNFTFKDIFINKTRVDSAFLNMYNLVMRNEVDSAEMKFVD